MSDVPRERSIWVEVVESVPPPGRPHGPVKLVNLDLKDLDGRELEAVVDADLDKFALFYGERLGNGNLTRYERAAIKTYLHWKTHPEK